MTDRLQNVFFSLSFVFYFSIFGLFLFDIVKTKINCTLNVARFSAKSKFGNPVKGKVTEVINMVVQF